MAGAATVTPAQKRYRIRTLVEVWRVPLGLGNWALEVHFNDATDEQASCVADPEYRKGLLTFNLKRLSVDELDETVLHEMLHCVGWPIAALAGKWAGRNRERAEVVRQAEELLITHLSNVILPLLPRVVTRPLRSAG